MTSYGITDQGYNLKTFDVIFAELAADCRAAFGDELNTQADAAIGQFLGILGDALAEHHELMQAVNASQDIASSSGAQLDVLVAFANVLRRMATSSVIPVRLNLAASTTLAIGRKIAIGANGAQFTNNVAIANLGTSPAIVTGEFSSVDTGPIVGNAFTVDTIITPVSGWSAKAVIESANAQPFNMSGSPQFILVADDGAQQPVIFVNGDFVTPAAATAAEVATKINSATTLLTATAMANGKVRIESDTNGAGSAIQAIENADSAGPSGHPSATAVLGLTHTRIAGMNPSEPARKVSGNAGPFSDLVGLTLSYRINGGSIQVFTFVTGATSARAAASQIMGQIATAAPDIRAYDDTLRLVLETVAVGAGVAFEVIGGTANTALGFDTLVASGLDGDATAGQVDESDADLKKRYFEQLGAAGVSVLGSIRAAVRALDGVRTAFIIQNDSDVTDGNGLPPHSIEVVVQGGDDQEIAAAIFRKNSSGTQTYRDPGINGRTMNVVDANGDVQQVNFSRATDIRTYVAITVNVDPEIFGGGDQTVGESLVAAALVALNLNTQEIGSDVIAQLYRGATIAANKSAFAVAGVLDVTSFKIDTIFPPVNTTNIVINAREGATLATGDIVVTVTS